MISLGLVCISGGFFLLWVIASSPEASWLTLMPGCILAGIGLGFTNTPVTNTATGSLPPERAGMASGMEFSARMISLSLNIALMGLILANGITSRLLDLLPKTLSETRLIEITDILASGNLNILENYGISKEIAKHILMEGFSSVLLYGATATAVICFLAFITFERKILKN